MTTMKSRDASSGSDAPAMLSGFGNHFASEALPGALPEGRNSPQRPAYGLYAEQISGTAFTAPRAENRRSWLYRIRPAAVHGRFAPLEGHHVTGRFDSAPTPPDQMRWSPPAIPEAPTDFIDGLVTWAGCGTPDSQDGCAVHYYCANRDMADRFFYDADGELLIVPQQGRLLLATELGKLTVQPGELAVVPRGIRFQVALADGTARGYVCENFGVPLRLPDLGPIGSNGLANPRDFSAPTAWYERRTGDFTLIAKFAGALWAAPIDHSPLDVVAWHGNHVPYKYDLYRFNTIGSISYDHPDPSIFLVLQSPTEHAGVDNVAMVVFPPRWLVGEDTFRPPWYHRNIASEFMGLIHGTYDAKGTGFAPGGASLHNCMTGHGPDAESFETALAQETSVPQKLGDTMAFMFETRMVLRPTAAALAAPERQADYGRCWHGLADRFDPDRR